jgi:c-di-GMP-binding flagellar brake protein YcgR
MSLSSLLICPDAQAVQVLTKILRELDIQVEYCADLALVNRRISAQQFDAVILDCQDQVKAVAGILDIRRLPAARKTLIIGLVDGREQVRDIFTSGANFVIYKPVSAMRAESSLRAARGLMKREQRTKLRIALHAPASIAYAGVESASATVLDLSESGLSLQSQRRLPPQSKVYFQFSLPGGRSAIRLSGDVVWQDASGRVGIRFVDVPQTSRRALQDWITTSLDTQAEADEKAARAAHASEIPSRTGGLGLSAVSSNRRVQSRLACRLSADVYRVGEGVPNRCTLSDISAGGCYVEMSSPFTSGTVVEIVVRTPAMKLRVRGTTQTVHPGFGMGVRFSLSTAREQDQVRLLVACQSAEAANV